jgi:hypothetical protein
MKKLIEIWKNTFLKYFDINQNGKLDYSEVLFFLFLLIAYNLFFQILGNYIYDLIKK